MNYDAEIKASEKTARKACPIAFALYETLLALRRALESAQSVDRARRECVQRAVEDAGVVPAAASRAAFERSAFPYDTTEEQARAVLESVGLLPESVVICGDCGRESKGSHECSAQRRSNRKWAARHEVRA